MPPGAYRQGGTPPAPDAAPKPVASGAIDDPARVQLARSASRSANRAAKRAASGRPPAGTPRRPARRTSTTGPLIAVGAVAAAVVLGVIAFGNPFGSPAASGAPSGGGASPAAYGDGTCPTSPPAPLAAGDVRDVTIETELGNIVMRIDGALAPNATGNFVELIECHYYDGVVFHRLMPNFVIQGGDPDGTGSGPGPGYNIEDDPLTTDYRRGTVAMARSQGPDSQGSQFFIVLSDSADQSLKASQYPYAILGEVTSGMEVVDQIAAMPNSGGQSGTALDPVEMTRVTAAPATGASPSPAVSGLGSPAPSTSNAPASTISGGPVFPSEAAE